MQAYIYLNMLKRFLFKCHKAVYRDHGFSSIHCSWTVWTSYICKCNSLGVHTFIGALAISVLNLPALTRVSENAITAAAAPVKEASLGLGATRWQTISRVVLPSAIPQILTGVILAAGRIFGEAAALLYTAGMTAPKLNFSFFSLTNSGSAFSVMRPAESLAVYIWKLNSEGMVPDAAEIANKASAVLVIMVLLFNFLARIIGKKIYESYTGKK